MSTFAVFGMTRNVALEEARRTVKTTRRTPLGEFGIPMSEWLHLCEKRADEIMGGTKVKQLSALLDAPPVRRRVHPSGSPDSSMPGPAYQVQGRPDQREGRADHRQEDRGAEGWLAGLRRTAESERGVTRRTVPVRVIDQSSPNR